MGFRASFAIFRRASMCRWIFNTTREPTRALSRCVPLACAASFQGKSDIGSVACIVLSSWVMRSATFASNGGDVPIGYRRAMQANLRRCSFRMFPKADGYIYMPF